MKYSIYGRPKTRERLENLAIVLGLLLTITAGYIVFIHSPQILVFLSDPIVKLFR